MDTNTICDSIAIKVLPNSNRIIQSIGNELYLVGSSATSYDDNLLISKNRMNQTTKLNCKFNDKIHGLDVDVDSKLILIYGGREFGLLFHHNDHLTDDIKDFQKISQAKINDWISNGKIIDTKADDNVKLYLLTAHSVLVVVKYFFKLNAFIVDERFSCTDKSTLYCSHLLNLNRYVLVFGGNAFGEIIIWNTLTKDDNNHCPVLYRFSAHKGVIFSIDVNLKFMLMTTTSDDRSIRVWKINNSLLENTENHNNDVEKKIMLHKSGYAHTSRVFKGKIIEKDDHPFIISVGEDSNMCIWDINCELIFKKLQHFGAIIWNFDYDPNTMIIFTSGSDSNLMKYNLKNTLESYLRNKDDDNHEMDSDSSNENDMIRADDYSKIKVFYFVCNGEIEQYYAGYNFDNCLEIRTQNKILINKITLDKCTLFDVNVINDKCFIFVGGYRILHIYEYSNNSNEIIEIFKGELTKKFIKSLITNNEKEILICDDFGYCVYSKNYNFENMINFELPILGKERWFTTGIIINKKWIIICSRQGHMYLYKLNDDNDDGKMIELKFTLKQIHGHLGVTFIENINLFNYELYSYYYDKFIYLKTCGRDGTIKTIKLDKIKQNLCIIHAQNVSSSIMWLTNFYESNNIDIDNYITMSNQLITGFIDNYFIIWSKNVGVIKSILCGGGHRYYDIFYHNNLIYFTFLKNKNLYTYRIPLIDKNEIENYNYKFNLNSISIPIKKFHIKSCNILKLIKNTSIIVSGGEDNKLLISDINSNNIVYEIDSHISSIKNVHFIKMKNNTNTYMPSSSVDTNSSISKLDVYLIFSCGGRAQICVTKYVVINENLNLQLKLNNLLNEEICNYMLKLSDYDRKYQKKNYLNSNSLLIQNNQNQYCCQHNNSLEKVIFDPEMRFMSIDVLYDHDNDNNNDDGDDDDIKKIENFYTIFTGCSDGYIRKFLYDPINNKISLVTELFYGKCILHVKILQNINKNKKNYLFSAATDGYICIWNIENFNSKLIPYFKIKHHDSGVNSLDIQIIENFQNASRTEKENLSICIASGGDDQNVVITILKIINDDIDDNEKIFEIIKMYNLKNLHLGQVNGIKFSYCKKFLYTVGTDQIICKLNALNDMKLIKKVNTCISDIKGIEIYNNNGIDNNYECIVYGCGRQFISFKDNN